VGEVGEEEDKAPMVMGLKEPVKFCFFHLKQLDKLPRFF
jgi:hypothetical protein